MPCSNIGFLLHSICSFIFISRMAAVTVNSPNVTYTKDFIESQYDYQTTSVSRDINGSYVATPTSTKYTFKTDRRVPKLGVMLVGWGGNNGSTVTAAVLANKLNMEWNSKEGLHSANFFGSITQASTVCLGTGPEGEIFVPMKDLLPMVDPEDIIFDGKLVLYFTSDYLFVYGHLV